MDGNALSKLEAPIQKSNLCSHSMKPPRVASMHIQNELRGSYSLQSKNLFRQLLLVDTHLVPLQHINRDLQHFILKLQKYSISYKNNSKK
jgi:hypothetical protein